MALKQLTVFLENKEGHLNDVLKTLADNDVTGVLQRLGRILRAMAGALPAVENIVTACDLGLAAAVEAVVQSHSPLLQCRRQGHTFECRARLIAVRNAADTPLEQPRLDDLAVVFIPAESPGRCCPSFFLLGLVVELLQLFLGGGIVDLQVVIGVICPHRRHGQNLAGVDVHHDAERAVLHIVLRNGGLHVLLKIILHRRVDRRNQAAAVGRLVVFFVGVEHFRLVVALCRDDSPGIALEGIVVVGFQALGADVFCNR